VEVEDEVELIGIAGDRVVVTVVAVVAVVVAVDAVKVVFAVVVVVAVVFAVITVVATVVFDIVVATVVFAAVVATVVFAAVVATVVFAAVVVAGPRSMVTAAAVISGAFVGDAASVVPMEPTMSSTSVILEVTSATLVVTLALLAARIADCEAEATQVPVRLVKEVTRALIVGSVLILSVSSVSTKSAKVVYILSTSSVV